MVASAVFATAASVILATAAAGAPPANPPLACHGPCMTRCASAYDPPYMVGPPSPLAAVPRFYLHDEGGFNFSDVSAAVDRLLGGSPPDDVLPVDMAQHLFEYPLLRALRTHPQRTLSAGDAEVHVIGAMPFVSWALADLGICLGDCSNGSLAEHQTRMHGVAEALRSNRYWNASRQQGTPFVLIVGHYSHYRHITESLTQELRRGNAMLAVSDPMHGKQMPAPKGSPLRGLVSHGITMPYWAHAHAAYVDGNRAERAGLMFHGGVGRHDYGTRDRLVRVMRLLQERGDPVDLRLAEFTRGGGADKETLHGARRAAYQASGRAFLNASLCPSPAGDTTTSRRLFDAMSAACVPILLRQPFFVKVQRATFYTGLPFPHSIDWRATTLRLLPSHDAKCAVGDVLWMSAWHGSTSAVDEIRWRVLAAYRAHLDYSHNPRGVASALLREVATRTRARGAPTRLVGGAARLAEGGGDAAGRMNRGKVVVQVRGPR